jgi:hypothetical protein
VARLFEMLFRFDSLGTHSTLFSLVAINSSRKDNAMTMSMPFGGVVTNERAQKPTNRECVRDYIAPMLIRSTLI